MDNTSPFHNYAYYKLWKGGFIMGYSGNVGNYDDYCGGENYGNRKIDISWSESNFLFN